MRSLKRSYFPPFILSLALAMLVSLFFVSQAHAAANSDRAAKFIEALADQAISALTQPDLSDADRQKRARALLTENFAIPTIGQFVLGRYWRQATPEEREEYLGLFEELIVVTYIDRFKRYSGEKLNVIGGTPVEGSDDVIVQSTITRPSGAPVEVGWRVRPRDDGMKIVDVYVEGVSMGQTQRSEFSSVIQSRGSLAGLIDEMHKRVQHAS